MIAEQSTLPEESLKAGKLIEALIAKLMNEQTQIK
jgi:hypothetical protein